MSAASLRGRRGIVRISPGRQGRGTGSRGMNVVGLAFGPDDDLIVATNDSVYRLRIAFRVCYSSLEFGLLTRAGT
jgi:hypothetical protein